ncbi:MAG: hypothetical protein J7L47_02135 [Candidatus Odinarchaeota archaeon]|nr:hypothetical protein [Candidatus Odinarchaeota archaeon]
MIIYGNEVKRIPKELKKALKIGGYSLIIKGLAGTGKTTLALELISSLEQENATGIYFTARVAPAQLVSHYPWALKDIPKERFIDARGGLMVQDVPYATVIKYSDVPEFLKNLFYMIDIAPKKPVTVVIDSLEELKANLSFPEENFSIERRLLELSYQNTANIIFITERKEVGKLDYLVDGIIKLERIIENGRIFRYFIIEKMRGIPVTRPVYIYTLKGAHFSYLTPHNQQFNEKDIQKDFFKYLFKSSLLTEKNNDKDYELINDIVLHSSATLFSVAREIGTNYFLFLFGYLEACLENKEQVIFVPSMEVKYTIVQQLGQVLSKVYSDEVSNLHVIDPMEIYEKDLSLRQILETLENKIVSLQEEHSPIHLVMVLNKYKFSTDKSNMDINSFIDELLKFVATYKIRLTVFNISQNHMNENIQSRFTAHLSLSKKLGAQIMTGISPYTNHFSIGLLKNNNNRYYLKLVPIL